MKKDFIVRRSITMVEGKPHVETYSEQELVRCKDCQFHYDGENKVDVWDTCRLHSINTEPDNYCSWAVTNRR